MANAGLRSHAAVQDNNAIAMFIFFLQGLSAGLAMLAFCASAILPHAAKSVRARALCAPETTAAAWLLYNASLSALLGVVRQAATDFT
jgi:hypothetical protein